MRGFYCFPKLELCLTSPALFLPVPSCPQPCDVISAEERFSWSCDFVGSYHSLRPTNCCFSADGSLLAVSFGEVVTVWSVDTWGLLTTMCQPPGAIRWGLEFRHATIMAIINCHRKIWIFSYQSDGVFV